MSLNVIDLTKEFISIPSVSRDSNVPNTDRVEAVLEDLGFEIERTEYTDPNGEQKANLVAKIGPGKGGLAFCSHNDTVPGQERDWPAFTPEIRDGNLYGRGSCDMKGPLAATIVAASQIDRSKLKEPVTIVVTADEEIGLIGAKYVAEHSAMLKDIRPKHGIVAEPTSLIPVYAHKGYGQVTVVAKGMAAHSSTGLGTSATFLMAPFLAEMAEYAQLLETDESYQNAEFTPPTHTMNVVINDHETALNVTAPMTTVRLGIRAMPGARSEEVLSHMIERAESYGFEVTSDFLGALIAPVSAEIVRVSSELTGKKPETVPYGTDGAFLQKVIKEQVILGPGDIGVAHTVGEFVPLAELEQAVDIYKAAIERLCF